MRMTKRTGISISSTILPNRLPSGSIEQRIEKLRQFMDEQIGKDNKFGKTYQEYFHLHYDREGFFRGADEQTDIIE